MLIMNNIKKILDIRCNYFTCVGSYHWKCYIKMGEYKLVVVGQSKLHKTLLSLILIKKFEFIGKLIRK